MAEPVLVVNRFDFRQEAQRPAAAMMLSISAFRHEGQRQPASDSGITRGSDAHQQGVASSSAPHENVAWQRAQVLVTASF